MQFDITAFEKAALKTVYTVFAALIVPVVLTAMQHPTGGLAAFLSDNPVISGGVALFGLLVHDYLSQIQTVPSNLVVPPDKIITIPPPIVPPTTTLHP